MSQRSYLHSSALSMTSRVVASGNDDHGFWVELDDTLFHPQGGGQRADSGSIDGVAVNFVADTGSAVRHYLAAENAFVVGREVALQVDAEARRLHARLHTGGHLLAAALEELSPGLRAIAGHHWLGESRVEIEGEETLERGQLVEQLQARCDELIAADLPVQAGGDGRDRRVQIGDFAAVPCGGTHLSNIADLGGLRVTGLKKKKGKFRLSYDLV